MTIETVWTNAQIQGQTCPGLPIDFMVLGVIPELALRD